MTRLGRVLAVGIVAVIGLGGAVSAQPAGGGGGAAGRRPNVLFVLTDDLGYGDVGAFFQNQRRADGRPAHATPHIDALAAEGVRLTHHYCPAPVCAPSRASLLLGVHQGHANVRDNQFDKALEDNHTLATVLRRAGYATAAIGKWGLQGKPETKPPEWPAHPLNRGFGYYYGYMRHADGHEHYPKEGVYRKPKEVWENRTEVSAGLDQCYTTDLFTARAKQWIVDHRKAHADQPFFMYLAYDTPHAVCELPTQAYPAGGGLKGGLQWIGKPGEMINTARGGRVDSWVHPDYAGATWDADGNASTPPVAWPDVYRRYATSVRRIDDAVGDLVRLLKDLNVDDNTLVVFTSDNGPSIESYLPEKYSPVFFGSYGPFDGIKRDVWEGGLRVPTVARWPGVVLAGRTSALPSSFPDWMPTFAQAAGVPAPARSDGVSLLPELTGQGAQQPPRVYVEYFQDGRTPQFDTIEPDRRGRVRKQMQALAIGGHVGVRYDVKGAADDFEIYDAVKDPKQTQNLANRPEAAALQQQFKDTALRVRRPGAGVKRPYDDAPVPPVTVAAANPGVRWRALDGAFPWVPQDDPSAKAIEGTAERPALTEQARGGAVVFDGYIEAPADGRYTFALSTDGGAVLRLHEATVIDADHGYTSGQAVTGEIVLKAGKHPFRLTCARRPGAADSVPSLQLEWAGPGIQKQPIPAGVFSREDAGR